MGVCMHDMHLCIGARLYMILYAYTGMHACASWYLFTHGICCVCSGSSCCNVLCRGVSVLAAWLKAEPELSGVSASQLLISIVAT